MRTEPHGAELLELARRTLLDEVVPAVPEAHRYALRMVANAIAIGARELDAATGDAVTFRADDAALADDIRAGRIVVGGRLLARLRADVAQRLAASNPRILERKA